MDTNTPATRQGAGSLQTLLPKSAELLLTVWCSAVQQRPEAAWLRDNTISTVEEAPKCSGLNQESLKP